MRITIPRVIVGAIVGGAGGLTYHKMRPHVAPVDTQEYVFTLNVDCDGDGQFTLRDWSGILSMDVSAMPFDTPVILWTAIVNYPRPRFPRTQELFTEAIK
jgi:hypothetical protein